jgi:hypothetical protein
MKDLIDYIFVRLYYRLFVRPRPAAKAAPEWDIDLPSMKAVYRGPPQVWEQSPFAGITMDFYLAGDGKGGKIRCGGLGTIPAQAQTALDNMNKRKQVQFMRRLIEEGDRVFRSAWEQSAVEKYEGGITSFAGSPSPPLQPGLRRSSAPPFYGFQSDRDNGQPCAPVTPP